MNAPDLKLATRVREGLPYPRGASWDGKGVNFAVYSAHATKVEVCLFQQDKETQRIELPEYSQPPRYDPRYPDRGSNSRRTNYIILTQNQKVRFKRFKYILFKKFIHC